MLLHFLMTHFLRFSLQSPCFIVEDKKQIFAPLHYASRDGWLHVSRICAERATFRAIHETVFIFIPISHRSRARNLQTNEKLVDRFAIVRRAASWCGEIIYDSSCGQLGFKSMEIESECCTSICGIKFPLDQNRNSSTNHMMQFHNCKRDACRKVSTIVFRVCFETLNGIVLCRLE